MRGPVTLDWYGCDLKTGAIAEELRSLAPTGALSRRLGDSTSVAFRLALGDAAPPDWEAATDQGRTMLVGVDSATGLPIWAGLVLTREGGSESDLALGTCAPEGYLDRRFPSAYEVTATDASTVMADLAAVLTQTGLPLIYDVTPSGFLIDYSTSSSDDKTVLSQLATISQMAGAPEWTIDVEWADAARTAFQFRMRIAPTIGVVDSQPEAVFDLPGCITTYRLRESYEQAAGATVVQASGDGEGEVRLTSVQTADDLLTAGWIRWVYRYSPGTGITSQDQLDAHATATLALMKRGTRAWSVSAEASRSPRIGADWGLGDSVSVQISSSPRHPDGVSIVARAYGWELDVAANRLSPILLEED